MSANRNTYYPNMDLMRYVLAIAVMVGHINILTDNSIPFPISSSNAVGGFFALSGFLMYPSYVRHNNPVKYAAGRARRILPPYFFIVLLCAFSFVCISSLSVYQYFSSFSFWKYLAANLSFLNWLQPDLPGVFEGSQYYEPAVNGSLWTMKVEWCLYFSVPLFVFLVSKFHLSRSLTAISVIIISFSYRLLFLYLYNKTNNPIFRILSRQIFGQLMFFYSGMIIYFYKTFFTKHLKIFLLIGLSAYSFIFIFPRQLIINSILGPLSISLVVLSISLYNKDLKFLRHKNNISYDMYLFHFPIIQLSIFWGVANRGILLEFIFVFILTISLSLFSNRYIDNVFKHPIKKLT